MISCKAPIKEEIVATLPEIPQIENEVSPYYSITTQYASHRVNYFMDVDIKIPKITYTGIEKDELFDSINDELYNNITKHVKDAMNESFDSYNDYLEKAKTNILLEQENRMRGLKTKYKDVISEKEISAINETIENLRIVANENKQNATKSNIVNGFSSTEDLIIPGLHNKNIIIVESTEASQSELTATNDIEASENSRPNFGNGERPSFGNGERPSFGDGERPSFGDGERPSFGDGERPNFGDGERPNFGDGERKRRGTQSNTDRNPNVSPNRQQNNNIASISDIKSNRNSASRSNIKSNNENDFTNAKVPTPASKSNMDKKLTLADFYDEFAEILDVKTPTDEELTKAYTPTIINCNFDVKCLDEDYLSLFVELNITKTATSVTRLFYNVNLREKRIIDIKDVLGDNYKELCIKNINEAIDKMSYDQKKNINTDFNIENLINEKTNFFINNNHIPVVELDKYTITPSYLEFQIFQ